jgi:hypothetical protein
VQENKITAPEKSREFLMSFVWGSENVAFFKTALIH